MEKKWRVQQLDDCVWGVFRFTRFYGAFGSRFQAIEFITRMKFPAKGGPCFF